MGAERAAVLGAAGRVATVLESRAGVVRSLLAINTNKQRANKQVNSHNYKLKRWTVYMHKYIWHSLQDSLP